MMALRRRRVLRIGLLVLVAGLAYAAFCAWTGWGIPCIFHLVTGLQCPGCGVSRMLLALLRLDFREAFRANPALLCMLPLLLLLGGRILWLYVHCGTLRSKDVDAAAGILCGVLLVFGAVRNFV